MKEIVYNEHSRYLSVSLSDVGLCFSGKKQRKIDLALDGMGQYGNSGAIGVGSTCRPFVFPRIL